MGKRAINPDGFIIGDEPVPPVLPVKLNGRTYRGELDIRIDAQGTWHYNANPITRKEMVCLFSSMLMKDECGHYWLVSPNELGRIEVEDAPFIAVELFAEGHGRDQTVSFRTNVDRLVTVTTETPLVMRKSPTNGTLAPYFIDDNGLEAKLSRPVYYELVELGSIHAVRNDETFGIWSDGAFFPLGKIHATDA